MTLANARKKIEKMGLELKTIGHLFYVEVNNRVLEFNVNGGIDDNNDICCILTRGKNDNHDSMTDYCAGVWRDNLTQGLKALLRN